MTNRVDVYEGSDLTDAECEAARRWAREKPSPSYLQRKMQIPYSHAVRLIELLEAERFVTEPGSDGRRQLGPAATHIKQARDNPP